MLSIALGPDNRIVISNERESHIGSIRKWEFGGMDKMDEVDRFPCVAEDSADFALGS